MKEEQAEKLLDSIVKEVTGGKGLKRYTRLDLVQFIDHWEQEKAKGKKMHQAISTYIPVMERRSAKEMLDNIFNAFNLEEE